MGQNKTHTGIKKVRMKKLPLVCVACGKKRIVESQQAYVKGGIACGCKENTKFQHDVQAFGGTK